jgi:hypothetical protein
MRDAWRARPWPSLGGWWRPGFGRAGGGAGTAALRRSVAARRPARWRRPPGGPPRAQPLPASDTGAGVAFAAAQQFDPGDGDADDGQAHRQAHQREPASGLRAGSRTVLQDRDTDRRLRVGLQRHRGDRLGVREGERRPDAPGSRTCVGSSRSESARHIRARRGAGRAGRQHVRRLGLGVGDQRRDRRGTARRRRGRRCGGRCWGRTLYLWRGRAEDRRGRPDGRGTRRGRCDGRGRRGGCRGRAVRAGAPGSGGDSAGSGGDSAGAPPSDNPPGPMAAPTIVARRLFADVVNPGVSPGGRRCEPRRCQLGAGRRRLGAGRRCCVHLDHRAHLDRGIALVRAGPASSGRVGRPLERPEQYGQVARARSRTDSALPHLGQAFGAHGESLASSSARSRRACARPRVWRDCISIRPP